MRRILIWLVPLSLILLFVFAGILPCIKNTRELRTDANERKNRFTDLSVQIEGQAVTNPGNRLKNGQQMRVKGPHSETKQTV